MSQKTTWMPRAVRHTPAIIWRIVSAEPGWGIHTLPHYIYYCITFGFAFAIARCEPLSMAVHVGVNYCYWHILFLHVTQYSPLLLGEVRTNTGKQVHLAVGLITKCSFTWSACDCELREKASQNGSLSCYDGLPLTVDVRSCSQWVLYPFCVTCICAIIVDPIAVADAPRERALIIQVFT